MSYNQVPAAVDFPALEHEIIQFWADRDIFTKSLQATSGGKPWTFYEGPPTANGMPGTHHIEARVFKDLFPRFKTMQGHHVDRKAGWDCHGLPVELAVEKELGFSGKPDIEAYGVEAFNARCRESGLLSLSDGLKLLPSAAVVGINRYIIVRQVAGIYRCLFLAALQVDAYGNFILIHNHLPDFFRIAFGTAAVFGH